MSEYFVINKMLLTVRYSFYAVIWSDYFAANEILLTAKYSLYIIIVSEYFAANEVLIKRLPPRIFHPTNGRGSRDPIFAAFAVCRPPFLLEEEIFRKREYLQPVFSDYFYILIACFYSYASFIILLLHELRVKLRVSNSSGKYITSPCPFFLVAVNGDREHLPLEN